MAWFAIAAAAVSAASSMKQSQAAASTAEFNQAVAESNAVQTQLWANEDARRMREAGARDQGRMRARAAASGVDVGTGSVLDVLSDEAITNELEALSIQARGYSQARAQRTQGDIFGMQASNTRSNAPLSALGAGMSTYGSMGGKFGGSSGGLTGTYSGGAFASDGFTSRSGYSIYG